MINSTNRVCSLNGNLILLLKHLHMEPTLILTHISFSKNHISLKKLASSTKFYLNSIITNHLNPIYLLLEFELII
jgi:hypothetical protein